MYRASVASLALACTLAVSFISVAQATPDIGAENNGLSAPEEFYLQRYAEAQERFGSAAVGANVVDDGTARYPAYNLPDSLVASKTAVLEAMLNPPPASAPVAPDYAPEPSTAGTDVAASGGYSIPSYIVECESGGSYTASNPSGAYGAYQIMPSTAASYGCDLSTPAGQDACASEIYADVGSSAWTCG